MPRMFRRGLAPHQSSPAETPVRGAALHSSASTGLSTGSASSAGFTLLEILLVIAIIVALAGMIFGAIRVQRIFTNSLDAEHEHYRKQLESAMYQHLVSEWELLSNMSIPEGQANAKPICTYTVTADATCVNLDGLIPTYMAALPRDRRETNPNYTGYTVYKNSGRVLVVAAHLGEPAGGGEEGGGGPSILRVSLSSDGNEGDNSSNSNSRGGISADGRFIAFLSDATNLVASDTNDLTDVFVHDVQTSQTTRVSIASDGTQADDQSGEGLSMSGDGRYVVFDSMATSLVLNDTNSARDIFLHDRQTGQTTRVSVASDGSQGNDESANPAISANGRYVAFWSSATNLVASDTNSVSDIFVRDLQTSQTTRVSIASDGTQGNSLGCYKGPDVSSDGRFVAFTCRFSNLVAGDTNGQSDVFLHDRQTGQTTRVSVASDGSQGNGYVLNEPVSMSADGRWIAFGSTASNLTAGDANPEADVFVKDSQTGQVTLASKASDGTQGDGIHFKIFLSGDGASVAFSSTSSNLVAGDTYGLEDAFLHDLQTGQTFRLSTAPDGSESDDLSIVTSIDDDGSVVVFYSGASNLVTGDTNGVYDIFMWRE